MSVEPKGTHPPSDAPRNSRQVAARIVCAWLEKGTFADHLLSDVSADAPFVTEVVLGIIRARRLLEWYTAELAPAAPRDPLVAAILYVGLYQLLLMDRVAAHAAVHETVEAARSLDLHPRVLGFVNAILRRAQREKPDLAEKARSLPLEIRESHPDALVKRWIDRYGEEKTAALCRWNNERPETTLTLVPGRTDMRTFLRQLKSQAITARPHPLLPDECVILPPGCRVPTLPGYTEGLFIVQDPSTIMAVDLLGPRTGERILDACAAPGGKAMLIAARLLGTGQLVATDTKAARLSLLRENAARLNLPVSVMEADLTRAAPAELGGPFDAVLLDAPCTNTGVLRRRPDARWRFDRSRQTRMLQLQNALLDHVTELVRPGGRLVYSTCSLEPEENVGMVRAWLSRTKGFRLIRQASLFPPESGTDGAFAALIFRD